MKLAKFFVMAALALVAASCSDDDEPVITKTTYVGELSGSMHFDQMMGGTVMPMEPSQATYTLTVNDNTLDLFIPGTSGSEAKAGGKPGGKPSMTMPDVELKNIQIVRSNSTDYTFTTNPKDTIKVELVVDGLKKIFRCVDMNGSVKGNKLTLKYKHRYGNMPAWFHNEFEGQAK